MNFSTKQQKSRFFMPTYVIKIIVVNIYKFEIL